MFRLRSHVISGIINILVVCVLFINISPIRSHVRLLCLSDIGDNNAAKQKFWGRVFNACSQKHMSLSLVIVLFYVFVTIIGHLFIIK